MSYNPLRLFPYAPFTEPLPIPSAAPTAGNFVCLELSREWLPYILGALEVYRWEDAWDAQGAALLQTLEWVQELLYLLASAYGVCMDGVTDISIDGCNLTVTYSDAPSKTIDLTECAVPGPEGPAGPTGATGATGPAGLDGASVELRIEGGFIQWRQDDDSPTWANLIALSELQGPQGEPGMVNVPAPIADDTGRDRQCGSAQRVADLFWDSLDDSLDATDNSVDVPALLDVIWRVFNPIVDLSELFQTAQDFTGYNTTTVRAEKTSTAKNEFTEWLFCNGAPTSPVTIGDWWRDTFTGGTELAGFAETLARMIPQTTYETAKGLGSTAPSGDCETLWGGNCPDPGWTQVFDFTATDGGFSPITGQGEWIAGLGWRRDTSAANHLVRIQRSFASRTITRIQFTISSVMNGDRNLAAIVIWDGSSDTEAFRQEPSSLTTFDTGSISQSVDKFNLVAAEYNSGQGLMSQFITSCIIEGEGVNPF